MGRRRGQLAFKFRSWGGKRRHAGRKAKGDRAGVRHGKRPNLSKHHPVHVTWRVRPEIWNLRGPKCFAAIARSFARGCDRRGFRLVHFSVQGNHMHLIVEAPDQVRLSRGLQGLAVRIARGVNRVMQRTGRVFADRYHEHVLRTAAEVANAVAYVLGNFTRHALRRGARIVESVIDPCSSGAQKNRVLVRTPLTWLLERFGSS